MVLGTNKEECGKILLGNICKDYQELHEYFFEQQHRLRSIESTLLVAGGVFMLVMGIAIFIFKNGASGIALILIGAFALFEFYGKIASIKTTENQLALLKLHLEKSGVSIGCDKSDSHPSSRTHPITFFYEGPHPKTEIPIIQFMKKFDPKEYVKVFKK